MILYYPFDLFVEGDYVYVLALVDHKWLQVYDKNTGELVDRKITEGQGPGELIMSNQLYYNANERTLSIYDMNQRRLLFYRVEENGDLSFVKDKSMASLGLYGALRWVWPLNDEVSLADGQLDSIANNVPGPDGLKRFQLFSQGKILDRYDSFPVEAEDRYVFQGACTSLSPDGHKMAVGTMYGGILETFDISAEHIALRKRRMFYSGKLDPKTLQPTLETLGGMPDVCATDDKIYTVFGEPKTIVERINSISVFDWDGNEVVQYKTDCNLLRLYYSSSDPAKLYGIAISDEDEYYLVSFDLP